MAYTLEGSILEVCDCNVLCPCWIGEDPDNGTCDSIIAYHIDRGTINGVDVSGLTMAMLAHIPGNVLDGNFRAVAYLDDKASQTQIDALLAAFGGKLGGPLEDMAKLVGETVAVVTTTIEFHVKEGRGTLKIGDEAEAIMEPYRGPNGEITTLNGSIFSTIPGSPAYVSKASRYRVKNAALGLDIDLEGHNAIQGSFRFEG
ncbi:MAG: DUF1326 domain-containing protein [Chloroflexi bacterium]|nr:DUF1326 domain-containing protein [Chloroflexota bacterium]